MPITVRKFNAQVKDPNTGEMIPAGILSSDSITQIAAAENAAITRINSKKTEAINQITQMEETIPSDYADFSAEAAYKDMIAQTQAAMTATKSYTVGEYICVNKKLYKTTTAITSGLALVVGTNVEEVKLAESVSASTAQIATNTNDISDLKTHLETVISIQSINIYGGDLSAGYVRPTDGEFIEAITTKVTDYLPVTAGKYVVSSYSGARLEMYLIAVFDSTKTVIAESSQRTGDGTQRASGYFFMPANAAYVRVTYLNANVHDSNKLFVEDETDYNPSITNHKSLVLDDNTLLPFVDIATARNVSANIYDGTTTNGYVNPATGVFTSGSTTKVTDYLPVIPGKYLTSAYNAEKNEMYMISFFDFSKSVIPETVQQSGDGKQRATGYVLIPDDCNYVRVTWVNANTHSENKLWLVNEVTYNPINTYMKALVLDNGDTLLLADIVSYNKLSEYLKIAFSVSHKYYKQKIVAMGDSITNGQTWFDGVKAYFGYRPVNKGVAGSTVSTVGSNGFCTDARVNAIPEDTKVLLIMGGVNDWLSNVPLGDKELDNADTTTFYGAVNVLIQKLNTRIPDATLICMGDTFATYPGLDGGGIYNTLGLCSLDYGQAFVDMCNLNGVKGFVVGYECWNKNNISTYVNNEGNSYLHPNSTGGAKMAEVIIDHIS